MINISDEDKAIWDRDSVKKDLSISIPGKNITLSNEDIAWEKFELTETLENKNQLTFTGCNASRVKFEIAALTADIRGEYIEISITAENADAIPLFKGYVDTQERTSSEDISCKITAYDKFYTMRGQDVASWFNGLTFPITLSDFRAALAAQSGIEVETASLIFDNLTLTKTISPDAISAADLWKNVCSVNGVYGRINRYGKLEFINLAKFPGDISGHVDPGTIIDSTAAQIMQNRYKKIEYDNYTVEKIDKVQIRESEDDIGGIYGDGTNAYIVENNWITYDRTALELASMAQTLYNQVSDYYYMPAKITTPGSPYLEIGDKIESRTAASEVLTYIFARTLKGVQILEDVYTATGTKTREKGATDVNTKITQLAGKTNKLTRDVEQTQSEITDLAAGVQSEITQLSDSVSVEIQNIYNQLDGSINVFYTEEEPTLLNYPAWDFTYNIPCNNTVQTTDELQFVYDNAYYKKHVRNMVYNSVSGMTYRFKQDENADWYWEEIADTEYAVLMQKITALEVKDGEITSSVQELYSDVSDLSTISETHSSQITQTANSITAEVTRAKAAETTISGQVSLKVAKDDNNQIVSMLNASANQINLTGNRIKIQSDNFSLGYDGSIKATNAELSGKITATSGTIANLNVTSTKLSFSNRYGDAFILSPNESNVMKIGTAAHDSIPAQYLYITSGGSLNAYSINSQTSIAGYSLSVSTDITCRYLTTTAGTIRSKKTYRTKWSNDLGGWVLLVNDSTSGAFFAE